MSNENSKAFEYAKEIVVAALVNNNSHAPVIYSEGGKEVADFFEAIFNKLVELENK